MLSAIAVIGLVFSPIAGAMAFVIITHEEYSHHHPRRRDALMRPLEVAIVATVFFALLALALSALVPDLVERAS